MAKARVTSVPAGVPIRGWFADSHPHFRRDLLALARPKSRAAGSVLLQASDVGTDVFGVACGVVSMQCRFTNSDAVLLQMLWPGDWFGTFPRIVERGHRRISAVARSDTELRRVPGDDLRQLLRRRLAGQRWASGPYANLSTEIPASQAEIAMLCNVSRNTFSRVLKGFSSRRLVTIGYKSLTVNDPA